MYSYIIVEFLEDTYTDKAKLHIEPKPDQLIRVFANFQFIAEPVICGEPKLEQIQRSSNGTLVVEWGGTESVPDSIGNTQNSTILSCPTFM